MTLILTSYKMVGQAHVTKILNHIKQGKEHYPELVVGYDMVNEEEFTPLISAFMPSILGAQRTAGVTQNMATFFHAGETHDRTITNMHDAVLLNSKRLGHGFQLALFPNLLQEIPWNLKISNLTPKRSPEGLPEAIPTHQLASAGCA